MLPKGSISKVYEHYFTSPRYNDEILRAMREFFDRPDLDRGGSLETNEKSEGFFNEWFLYDFVLSSGKTILADFIEENPLQLPPTEMALYKNLLKSNKYGIFEVLRVDIDKGLSLQNLQTEKELYVYERRLTSQVKHGTIFFGRIGKFDDHYELIGADSFSLGKIDGAAKKYFRRMKLKLTPKIAHKIWENRGKSGTVLNFWSEVFKQNPKNYS